MNERNVTLTYTQGDGIEVRILAHLLSDLRVLLHNIEDIRPDVVCPVCQAELFDVEMYDEDGKSYDLYGCKNCDCAVTYITPIGYDEYHEAIVNGALEIEVDISEATVNL